MVVADAVTALGHVESSSTLLRSGSRRRSVLAHNGATCDLYVLGSDKLVHMYNPKGGSLRRVQLMRPQLLDESFLHSAPDFWDLVGHEQERLVRNFYGPGATLDVPHEVGRASSMRLRALALSACTASRSCSCTVRERQRAEDAPDALSAMPSTLGLSVAGEELRSRGYSHVPAMLRMSRDEREAMAQEVGMRPGHVQTLMMHLDGRLPAAMQSEPAGDRVCAGRRQHLFLV